MVKSLSLILCTIFATTGWNNEKSTEDEFWRWIYGQSSKYLYERQMEIKNNEIEKLNLSIIVENDWIYFGETMNG